MSLLCQIYSPWNMSPFTNEQDDQIQLDYTFLYVPWESLNSPPHQIINALQCKFESLEWCTDDLLLFELFPPKKIESVLHSYIHNALSFFFAELISCFHDDFFFFPLSFDLLFIIMEWNYIFLWSIFVIMYALAFSRDIS